jgi:hypothetical protein
MKKPPPRSRVRASYPARHQLDHVVPTVIHDPEEKMTALGRWTHHALKEPRKYFGWPAALIAGVFVAVAVWKLAIGGSSTTSEVWTKLEMAKSPTERLDLAKNYPDSPAATWALLQAATEFYNQALDDLPHNRDVALPTAKKALDAFTQVEREAPPGSPQARAAAFGKARTLELRNKLPEAIEQYQRVVKDWPGTPEAEEAKRLAEVLQDPQAAAFYKELYAYSPTKVTLPPYGSENLPLPPLGSSPLTAPGAPASGLETNLSPFPELTPLSVREVKVEPAKAVPTPATTPPAPTAPSKPAAPSPELPGDVFSSKPEPKAQAATGSPTSGPQTKVSPFPELTPPSIREVKVEPRKASPTPSTAPAKPNPELPADVFSSKPVSKAEATQGKPPR